MEYAPKIGLEVHAELKTKTKMFCDSPNNSDEKHPNVNICPICMGYPGVLPVINKEAVKSVLKVGLSIGGSLADYSRFARKNYFYPDLPKGYQISQYQHPLVTGGKLNGVSVRRVHLEEDTGRLVHVGNASLVDFNRAGVPLMELVTEPVLSSAKEARMFAEELQLLLRYLKVSDADMEKGQLRFEANISVMFKDDEKLGTKVEIKNLNSFQALERAIDCEIKRQSEVLSQGEKIVHETRGWNEQKQVTFSQRKKEEEHDYRYFPEPDLPFLQIDKVSDFKNLETSMPELPWEKRNRFSKEYGLKSEIATLFTRDIKLGEFFEETISEALADLNESSVGLQIAEITANYLISDLVGLMKEKFLNFENLRVTAENFADLILMIKRGDVSSRSAKDVLKIMVETGEDPNAIIQERGLLQVNDDGFIEKVAKKIISENAQAAEDYKKGKVSSLQFLLGKLMAETKGKSNPQKAREFLENILKS
ncbi:MAG: Asp-tRNA(Asn)/Glu-tRNA(Gln) amidotransferase subunit GatB [bacterium]|nr:Asp-tRNA(Asn)/Glu-tRNA(Gln) amidotransferase subunit GatB [bacterium]